MNIGIRFHCYSLLRCPEPEENVSIFGLARCSAKADDVLLNARAICDVLILMTRTRIRAAAAGRRDRTTSGHTR